MEVAPMLLVNAAQHDQAQDLRAKYPAQLLALELNLPPEEWTYDVGLVAARLVRAAFEFHAGDSSYDGSWLSKYFPPELVAARLSPGDAIPPYDDILAFLGIGGGILGAPLGFQVALTDFPVDDLDAALAAS
jgi:hypothetical protein